MRSTIKGITLSFLIDYNYGNKILSGTNYYAVLRGLHKRTLEGRDGIKTGVTEDGQPNQKTADAQGYYRQLAQQVTSIHVLDGDFIKLRQVQFSYSLPSQISREIDHIQIVSNFIGWPEFVDHQEEQRQHRS